MHHRQTIASTRSSSRVLLGLMCVGLVLLCGVLSATHIHLEGPATHAGCGLCATAHHVVQAAVSPVPVTVAQVSAAVSVSLPGPRSLALSPFALFIRPPPVHDASSRIS